jgi:hypothetical protein
MGAVTLLSNRATRQRVQEQQRTLAEIGACLDSQGAALNEQAAIIQGLAENQRILMTAMTAWNTRTRWQRLRWLALG